MSNTSRENNKKLLLIINIIIIISPLVFLKYFNVLNTEIKTFFESNHLLWPLPDIKLLLPIGISYYTFMAISYIIDVYNGDIVPEKKIGFFALYLSFFPLLLSGPIEKAGNMIPQFKKELILNTKEVTQGMKLMLWGYLMKLVVADRLGIYVDAIYGNINQHNGTSLLLASILNPIQLYADFGGYSLIAVGTAQILGFNVMQNFRRPFFATSMSEFWRRWHISLISWLTDYVYTPLSFQLRRLRLVGIIISILVTFIISGIWHGAALTFIIWGLLQGLLLSIEALTKNKKTLIERKYSLSTKGWYILLGSVLTFLLFSASQVFGRASSIHDALIIYSKIISEPISMPYKDGITMLYGFIGISILFIKEFMDEYHPDKLKFFNNKNVIIRWLSYYTVIILIIFFGVFGQEKFIYFQF